MRWSVAIVAVAWCAAARGDGDGKYGSKKEPLTADKIKTMAGGGDPVAGMLWESIAPTWKPIHRAGDEEIEVEWTCSRNATAYAPPPPPSRINPRSLIYLSRQLPPSRGLCRALVRQNHPVRAPGANTRCGCSTRVGSTRTRITQNRTMRRMRQCSTTPRTSNGPRGGGGAECRAWWRCGPGTGVRQPEGAGARGWRGFLRNAVPSPYAPGHSTLSSASASSGLCGAGTRFCRACAWARNGG